MAPHPGEMKLPAIIYSLVIGIMFYLAVVAGKALGRRGSLLLICGALSFVISDSLLAINKFYMAIPFSGFLIMLTCLFAQGAIVFSLLSFKTETQ